MKKKRIAIYLTGGTISFRRNPQTGTTSPTLSGEDILKFVPGIRDELYIYVIDFARIPGTHMTLRLMMELARQIRSTLADEQFGGIVVTHGTDTLEETAYLVDLFVANEKPIVFVGAMRSSSELDWDGDTNLTAAIRVASTQQARGLGTLVVMNHEILAARDATKLHSDSLNAFGSSNDDALGTVNDSSVTIRRRPSPSVHLNPSEVVEPVQIIKVAVGCDSSLIDACIDSGAKGIVIEALGCGNVPPQCVSGIKRAINSNLPVVITSRCFRGGVAGRYDYVGGSAYLRALGVIGGGVLNSQKARIKLSLALGVSEKISDIREIFEAN